MVEYPSSRSPICEGFRSLFSVLVINDYLSARRTSRIGQTSPAMALSPPPVCPTTPRMDPVVPKEIEICVSSG